MIKKRFINMNTLIVIASLCIRFLPPSTTILKVFKDALTVSNFVGDKARALLFGLQKGLVIELERVYGGPAGFYT